MRYKDFEVIISNDRLKRYCTAVGGNTRRAMKLYRLNLRVSQEMFTIISCFEVALRNAIDRHYRAAFGNDWLRNAGLAGGALCAPRCGKTPEMISNTVLALGASYSHPKLIAKMDFGFWRYLFARHQYTALGRTLLRIFPARPKSSVTMHYDNTFVFAELEKVNGLRNRIAHHEPICFENGTAALNTGYARQHYQLMLELFGWMDINEGALLYGLDHMNAILDKIDEI